MRKWTEGLKSGEFKQANGVLKSDDASYCCLGVLEKMCGMEFTWDADNDLYRDRFRAWEMPEFSVDEALGLSTRTTEEEDDRIKELAKEHDLSVDVDGCSSRSGVLAALNDGGASFELIAQVIEELGWDVDTVEGKEKIDGLSD